MTRLIPTSTTTAPGLDHVGLEKTRAAHRGHHQVGAPGELADVAGPGMADRHRAIPALGLLHQHRREGLAHDVAPPYDHHVGMPSM